jgi:hypothetical protein
MVGKSHGFPEIFHQELCGLELKQYLSGSDVLHQAQTAADKPLSWDVP